MTIEIEGGRLVFKYFYRGPWYGGDREDGPSHEPISAGQRARYREWEHNISRRAARAKNREACTEEKRETCDQITGNLCTGDCPMGDCE